MVPAYRGNGDGRPQGSPLRGGEILEVGMDAGGRGGEWGRATMRDVPTGGEMANGYAAVGRGHDSVAPTGGEMKSGLCRRRWRP